MDRPDRGGRRCSYLDVIERLREEDDDTYLTATMHEVVRHRQVIPNVASRLVVKPIKVGGFSFPEGVCLVPNAYLIHHDPEIYEDPYAFRPQRFVDGPGTCTWTGSAMAACAAWEGALRCSRCGSCCVRCCASGSSSRSETVTRCRGGGTSRSLR